MPLLSSRRIRELAIQAGFEAAGVSGVCAEDLPELAHFEEWIERGHAGEMEYLKKRDEQGRLTRGALDRAAPWARSVIVCAADYSTRFPLSTECSEPDRGWISRYAWSKTDYHDDVLARLRGLEQKIREAAGPAAVRTWCYVDTGPLVERVYARHAGVGWIGKNTCVINQQLGSWTFLGVILTSAQLVADAPAADRCGSCTRCIDACPTAALIAPYQLDSRRCIAYLTIEKRGDIPEELRGGMGRNVFGCDICQDVCPWNSKARHARAHHAKGAREELVNPALEWLASLTEEEFRRVFRNSPVKRAKYSGLRRNVAIAMGNSGDARFVPPLKKLAADGDAVVARHARWALKKIEEI
ncbi:MAG: tRNA epoxyqueuosine(34) reductase QueG [Acidobacteria bacterium]|nr:tRNA epoxyqueuosine(34) reductase QueG [Acidobacteriota bacterium]